MFDVLTAAAHELNDLLKRSLEHHNVTQKAIRNLGAVAPSNDFWKKEELRYSGIFHKNSNILASVREVLQNSSDAGTDHLDIVYKDLDGISFIGFKDNGRWCPEDVFVTYEKCHDYFLWMNGSGKSAESNGTDGGFGCGRFIILFCSNFWCFTARHMLVYGHYGSFQIVCRNCMEPINSEYCSACQLHEKNTPVGTTFLVNYDFLVNLPAEKYAKAVTEGFLRYTNTKFPIKIQNQLITPAPISKTIYQCEYFTAKKLDISEKSKSLYIVRTDKGIPMFSRNLYNSMSEKGIFVIDLAAHVNYTSFDQARQSLIGPVGEKFTTYMESRNGAFVSANIVLDHALRVIAPSISLDSLENKSDSSSSSTYIALTEPESERRMVGPISCIYFFRNGTTLDTIPTKWRPGYSWHQIYILLAWKECLQIVITAHNIVIPKYDVGFVFDSTTAALKSGNAFYINPVLLARKLNENFNKPSKVNIMAYLLSRAMHEVAHVYTPNHDEFFVSQMTEIANSTLVSQFQSPSLLRKDEKLRKAAKILYRDFQQPEEEKESKVSDSIPEVNLDSHTIGHCKRPRKTQKVPLTQFNVE